MSLLDETTYPFHEPDGKQLWDDLAGIYDDAGTIKALVRATTVNRKNLAFTGGPSAIWADVLDTAAKQGRLRQLALVIYDDSDSVGVQPLLKRLLTAEPVAATAIVDAYSLGMLSAGRAFINRVDLRRNLREFADKDGSRVLLVRGASGLGKSHSWHMIYQVGQKTNAYRADRFDLSSWAGPRYGPRDVMLEICQTLSWDVPQVDATAQPDTVVRLLVNRFKGLGKQLTQRTCLVFDGYTERTSDDFARKLIVGIADAANACEAGDVRVVLLEVDQQLTEELARDALAEDLHLGRLDDLPAFFTAAAAAVNHVLDDGGLELLMTQTLGPPPRPSEFSLHEVGHRAGIVARQAFRAQP